MREWILLVEDGRVEAELMRMVVADCVPGTELVTAASGPEAITAVEARGVAPLLAMVDFHLPGFNGDEVVRRLRGVRDTRFVPAVVLSASEVEAERARAYLAGANSWLVKPDNINEFREAVRLMVVYWIDYNRGCSPEADG